MLGIRRRISVGARRSVRGSALLVSMGFMLMATSMGLGFLAVTGQHMMQTATKGIETKLLHAAEAGIESKRGRFKLVNPTQIDWTTLLPNPNNWNLIDGPMIINGVSVQVEGRPFGTASVPRATIRAIATSGTRRIAVEYDIKVASFSDYSLYKGGTGTANFGANFKMVGNYATGGNMNLLNNIGVQFFGDVKAGGTIYNVRNNDYNYAFQGDYQENFPPITIPPDAVVEPVLKDQAESTNTRFAENTLEIIFTGTTFTRRFVRRKANAPLGNGTPPTGQPWINFTNGLIYSTSGVLNNSNYEFVFSAGNPIPDDGVIYVGAGTGFAMGGLGFDVTLDNTAFGNSFVQTDHTNTSFNQRDLRGWNFSTGAKYDTKLLLLSGTLDAKRVTVYCEYQINIRDNVMYQSMLDNPDWRRQSEKSSAGAMGYPEMLGVISKTNLNPAVHWWSAVPQAQVPGDIPGDTGHKPWDAYIMDGTFMGMNHARPHYYYSGQPLGEWWLNGGLIGGQTAAAGLGNTFQRRNYDWDWRMSQLTPPYFLNSYNVSAAYIKGSWRTYRMP